MTNTSQARTWPGQRLWQQLEAWYVARPVWQQRALVYGLLALPLVIAALVTRYDFPLLVDEELFHGPTLELYRANWPNIVLDYPSASGPLTYIIYMLYGNIFGFAVWTLRLLMTIVTFLTAINFYHLCRERELPFPLLTAAVFLFYPYVFFFGLTFYAVNWGLFFTVAALRFLLRDEDRLRDWLIGCVLISISVYTRQTDLGFALGLVLFRFLRATRGLRAPLNLLADIRENLWYWVAVALPFLAILPLYLAWGGLAAPATQSENYIHLVPEKTMFAFVLAGAYFLPMLLIPQVRDLFRAPRKWQLLLVAVIVLLPVYLRFRPVYSESVEVDYYAQGLVAHGLDALGQFTLPLLAEALKLGFWAVGVTLVLSMLLSRPWTVEQQKLLAILGAFLFINAFTPWVMERLYVYFLPYALLLFHKPFRQRAVLALWTAGMAVLAVGFTIWQVVYKPGI